MSKFLRLQETLANNLQSKHWQTCNTSVLHLGWSSMCFTALVGLVDSQMLQTVLCFFLLPGCSSASQTSQLQTRSGKHHDSCKRPKWFCEGTFICNGWDCQIKWHPFPRLPFPMSNLNQLGAFSGNWFCYDNGSAGKHQSTTLGSLYTFWQAKAPKPLPLKQLRTLSIRKYTQIFNRHIKFLRQPDTWQIVLRIILKLVYTSIPGAHTAIPEFIKMDFIYIYQCNSMQFRQFTSIQIPLDAWMEGWTDIANGWIRASTIIGTLIQCTVECPLLLCAGGSVAGKGTGPNLQHLVAISPWLLIALARTSKQTTTCHVMSHLSESVRIYHQPHHQQQYDQTKITQYKTDNANNY